MYRKTEQQYAVVASKQKGWVKVRAIAIVTVKIKVAEKAETARISRQQARA